MLTMRARHCFRILARRGENLALVLQSCRLHRMRATYAVGSRTTSIASRRASGDSAIDIGEVTLACKTERHGDFANRLLVRQQHLTGAQNSFLRHELMG